jgi:hypothetical protein
MVNCSTEALVDKNLKYSSHAFARYSKEHILPYFDPNILISTNHTPYILQRYLLKLFGLENTTLYSIDR